MFSDFFFNVWNESLTDFLNFGSHTVKLEQDRKYTCHFLIYAPTVTIQTK